MKDKKTGNAGKFEDVSSYGVPKGFRNKLKYFWNFKFKPFFLRNKKRNLKSLLSVFICLILVISAAGGAYLRKVLSLINHDEGRSGNPDATFVLDDYEDDRPTFNVIADVASADSIKELLRSWALNGGEKIYSKRVVNALLIGEDDEGGSHRSDSAILVSVNTKTKKITVTSFLRDAYTYMNVNGEERFDKTNHAYAWGGPAKLMEVLSDNYKVKIDRYASINYESFVKVIDLLGGVDVPITEREAAFMNRTTKCGGFESGDAVRLDGRRALIYARIRKLDSEVERTRRQRELINSVIKKVRNSSLGDLDKLIETFLPYVTTNFKSSEILSLGTQALSENWARFDVVSGVEPSEENRYGVDRFRTYSYPELFVWITDYVKAARELQLALYGQTNIEISPRHISAIDLAKGASYSNVDSNDREEETTACETRCYSEEESTTERRSVFDWARGLNRDFYREEASARDETEPTSADNLEDASATASEYYEEETVGGTENPLANLSYPYVSVPYEQ